MSFTNGYALVIGVGKYQYMSNYNVPIAAKDAAAVAETLQTPAICGYPADQVILLTDQAATRAALLSALETLAAKIDADSTLFLFFVGHGVYGSDGNYYLATHDSQLQGKQVLAGTGVSDAELLDKLRQIKARRMLLVINACHSGELSPSFDIGDETLDSQPPPQKLADAVLSTGEGRITITACRPEQKSWIGVGSLSIFTKAVVDGLKGGAPNNRGYISAFGLYEHVYFESKDGAQALGYDQEPELTVLKGIGPFPVALYHGASQPGTFDVDESLPGETAVRQVSPEKSRRVYQRYTATLIGDGAIAQGDGAKAVGAGGKLLDISGKVSGNVIFGDNVRYIGENKGAVKDEE
ncbi:MAG: caspase family protein [Anaerolineae bacterium]|nr:caspase family protein [Anaerolineae bacterium]